MAIPKRLKHLWTLAEAKGWTYSETKDGHPSFVPPRGLIRPGSDHLVAPIVFALTPSDVRGDRNAIAALRRAGVAVPHSGRTAKKTTKKTTKEPRQ